MKKVVRGNTTPYDTRNPLRAKQIKQKCIDLINLMENTTSGYLEEWDLGVLYEELIDSAHALSLKLGNFDPTEDDFAGKLR